MSIDDVLSTTSTPRLVVGVGGSASGLEAVERLLAALPSGTDMTFVLMLAPDPDPEDSLQQLSSVGSIEVLQGVQGVRLRPNTAYTIRPGTGVVFRGGCIELTKRLRDDDAHRPIDHLFLSLATELRSCAVGIVLCGDGNDGSEGIRAIKAAGGLTIARDPSACDRPGMPRSATETGNVDLVLDIEDMPRALQDFAGPPQIADLVGERKRLEAALRQSEERLRLAAQVAKVGTFDWHIPTDESIWTPELEALYGLPPGGFGGTYADWRRLIHPDDVQRAEAVVQQALDTGSFTATWRARWPDGTVRWLEARGWVEKDADGTPVRMIGVNLDVTERKEAEEALRRADELRRLALESARMGAWSMDVATSTITWDERSKGLAGIAEAELPLSRALALIHPDDRKLVEDTLAEAAQADSDRVYDIQFRVYRSHEPPRWVRGVGQVRFETLDSRRRPVQFVGILMDMTDQKRTEETLEEVNRRKDDYLAMLGHELRNPLAAIRTAGELVKYSTDGDSVLDRASAVLERQTAHMAELIDGLLDVSRITRGKLKTEKRPTDLVTLLRDVISDYEAEAEQKNVDLHAELEATSLPLHGDPARLTQVFDNLIGNAIKYTESGGTVTVQARAVGDTADVVVRDTGIGFEPELRSRLFEPFQQGPQDISRSSGGLGLGLALARGLIELHGGTIDGRSEGIGRGAEFVVRLPLCPTAKTSPSVQRPTGEGRGLHVLLIEDNEDSAEMLGALLERAGHDVEVATAGEQGVELARGHHPDVVLCDIGLPGDVTGFDVAQQLRADPSTRDVPLVAVTGYGRPEDKARSSDAGFDEHLVKPVDTRTIKRVLTRLGRPRHS